MKQTNKRFVARQVDASEWEVWDTEKQEQVKWYSRRNRKIQATEHAERLNDIDDKMLQRRRETAFREIVQTMHDRAIKSECHLILSAEWLEGEGVVFSACLSLMGEKYPFDYECFFNAEDALIKVLREHRKVKDTIP